MMEASSTTSPTGVSNDASDVSTNSVASSSNLINQKCIFCTEILTKQKRPKVLPCLHLICGTCSVTKNNSNGIECPHCEERFIMSRIREYQLADNTPLPLCSACEAINKEEGRSDAIDSATHYCPDCDDNLCYKCVDAHKRIKVTRIHNLQSLLPADTNVDSKHCPIHTGSNLDLFCTNCAIAVCTECFLTDHNSHGHEKMKDKISQVQQRCLHIAQQLNNDINQIQEPSVGPIERMLQSKENVKNELENYVHSLQDLMERKKREMLRQIDEEFLAKQTKFTEAQKRFKPLIERFKQCKAFAENLSKFNGGISDSKKSTYDLLEGHFNELVDRKDTLETVSETMQPGNSNQMEEKCFRLICYSEAKMEEILNQAMTYRTETVAPPTVQTNHQRVPMAAPPTAQTVQTNHQQAAPSIAHTVPTNRQVVPPAAQSVSTNHQQAPPPMATVQPIAANQRQEVAQPQNMNFADLTIGERAKKSIQILRNVISKLTVNKDHFIFAFQAFLFGAMNADDFFANLNLVFGQSRASNFRPMLESSIAEVRRMIFTGVESIEGISRPNETRQQIGQNNFRPPLPAQQFVVNEPEVQFIPHQQMNNNAIRQPRVPADNQIHLPQTPSYTLVSSGIRVSSSGTLPPVATSTPVSSPMQGYHLVADRRNVTQRVNSPSQPPVSQIDLVNSSKRPPLTETSNVTKRQKVDNQKIVEVSNSSNGAGFSGASGGYDLSNDPPKPKDACSVCYFGDNEDDDDFTPDECSQCGREYHLKCHYPILNPDIGELEIWTCRLCTDDTPKEAYGIRKQSFDGAETCERIILKMLLLPEFHKYFGREDKANTDQSKVQFVHVQKRLADRRYLEPTHVIEEIKTSINIQHMWPEEKKKVAKEANEKLNKILPIYLPGVGGSSQKC